MILAALLLQAAAPLPRTAAQVSHDAAFNGPEACSRAEIEGGTRVIVSLGDRSCVKFKAPRRFTGIWINAFEGQQFIDGATNRADVKTTRFDVWFGTDEQTLHDEKRRCPRQHICRVVFDGREAIDMHRRGVFEGYGHMSASAGLVLADRIVSIEDLGALDG